MAFDDVRLPPDIEQGAQGGPQFNTTILTLSSGAEVRNQNWSRSKALYNIAYGVTDSDDPDDSYATVIAFFFARGGMARGFRFKDWLDFNATAQACSGLANGTNTIFQLQKTYTSGAINYVRKITRPVSGTVNVYNNAVLKTLGTDYTIDVTTGKITFTVAPVSGHAITADFDFDVPVRFAVDALQLTASVVNVAAIQSIALQEVIE